MFIPVDFQELDLLRGADHSLTALYLYLKQFTDFNTGIVGLKRGISYQSISEALYIEPRQGVKGGSPHKSSIRRMLTQLEKLGLIQKRQTETLVFKLKFGKTDFSANKKADTKSTPQPDTLEASNSKAFSNKADTPKNEKADTPLHNNNYITTTTENKLLSTNQENAVSGCGCENLIFHKSLDNDTVQVIKKLVQPFNAEMQQELLDELHGYLDLKKIQSTPIALMRGFVERAKVGAFDPNQAIKVRNARNNKQQEAKAIEQQRKPIKRDIEKAQANMTNIRDILKHKKAV